MREIKFRAFSKKSKGMVFVEYATFLKDDSLVIYDDYEIMQYTGLKDKNGIEIYEGDIVQVVAEKLKYDETIQEFRSNVFFVDGSFSYTHDDGYSYPLDGICSENGREHEGSHFCEVIGNIYKNPELLK